MSIRRFHAIVHGRVQGVFYRDYTRQQAELLGVHGWVRNLPDGTVEAVIEGEADKVVVMRKWLQTGSPLAAVTAVDITDEEPTGERGFSVRY